MVARWLSTKYELGTNIRITNIALQFYYSSIRKDS